MLQSRLFQGIVVACTTCLGCGIEATEDPTEDFAEDSAALIGATIQNCSYPEVGILRNTSTGEKCSAALVAPDMILSAAHCFDYGTNELGLLTNFQFIINSQCGTSSTFDVIRYKSLGTEAEVQSTEPWGKVDVSIAQLRTSVPSPMASPMNFYSGSLPPLGTQVTDVGYGGRTTATCTKTGADGQKGVISYLLDVAGTNKRTAVSPYTTLVCPGDSGGPVFRTGDRRIFWVNSHTDVAQPTGYSLYGEVWNHTNAIENYMANWSCPGGVWWDGAPVTKDQRYPYARVCGLGGQNYECTPASHAWMNVGGSCGSTSCQCANGAAFGDVAIPPDRTTCGSTACGKDEFVYTCTSGGWQVDLASRCGATLPVSEAFPSMPVWTSSVNATWGGAATWSNPTGGQSGRALQAVRSTPGSSAKVKTYTVSPNTWYTATIYMKVNNSTADFWAEAAVKPGTFSANDFDLNPGTWKMIKKFSKATSGNGGIWNPYSVMFNSGPNTKVSVGFKLGNLSGTAPTVLWDTLTIQ